MGMDGSLLEKKVFPTPTADRTFKAFGSIMFAFAGASTFPTIQADMKDRSKFNISAIMAMGVLLAIYFPMAAGCYFSLGDQVTDNIVLAMSVGWQRITVEIMLLLHLISAYASISKKEWVQRKLPLWERIYCWALILIGIAGGACATVTAVRNIFSSSLSVPCYLMGDTTNVTISAGGH